MNHADVTASERLRHDFLAAYQAAIARVNGLDAVARALTASGEHYTHAVAVGKAAAAMMEGAVAVLGNGLEAGLVITKHGHLDPAPSHPGVRALEASHPVADASSLAAGAALVDFIESAPGDARLLLLFSGGASALADVLAADFGPDDLSRVNQWLLASGLSIGPMNRIRKRLSRIKGGRLASVIAGRPARAMLISDVPGDDPKVVGSGLACPHAPEDLDVSGLDLPGWLREMADRGPPLAPPGAFESIRTEVVARPADARRAAVNALAELGYAVTEHDELLEGEAAATGRLIVEQAARTPDTVHVYSSETTVVLPDRPGRGGRCQTLALAAAEVLATLERGVVLAAGTDGTDGPVEDAGALVDAGTLARGTTEALDAPRALARADAGSFLDAAGDLVTTGPTGTNVMDLLIVQVPAASK